MLAEQEFWQMMEPALGTRGMEVVQHVWPVRREPQVLKHVKAVALR
jgi:hypothetical protein